MFIYRGNTDTQAFSDFRRNHALRQQAHNFRFSFCQAWLFSDKRRIREISRRRQQKINEISFQKRMRFFHKSSLFFCEGLFFYAVQGNNASQTVIFVAESYPQTCLLYTSDAADE